MKNTDNKITKSEEENQNSNESNLKDIEWDKFDTGDIILFSGKNFWFSYKNILRNEFIKKKIFLPLKKNYWSFK